MIARRLFAAVLFIMSAVPASAKTLEAVASFTIVADMVHQVGGERVHVASLVGPNGDPHAYEPTPDDARRLKAADLVFVSGLGLEGWMDRLITASGYRGKVVVATTGIRTQSMREDGKRTTDPHAWNSARNGIVYAKNIVQALCAVDPDGAAIYTANGERYIHQLQDLDNYTRQQVAAVPPAKRKVLTSHEALSYFGTAYGVTFLAPLGISTESEASAQGVAKLIRQIRAEHVKAYFFEASNDPRLVRQIANATGAEPGGSLYVEALSPPDGPAPTYAALFRYNVDALVAAMKKN
jgi:zinc/manganese transport system substrate-binding protein